MRITCPNCDAQYEVSEDVIPDGGRDLQCSACEKSWFQQKLPVDDVKVTVPDEVPAQDAVEAPAYLRAVASTIVSDDYEEEEEEISSGPSVPPKRDLDAGILAMLREEAERETQARHAEEAARLQAEAERPVREQAEAERQRQEVEEQQKQAESARLEKERLEAKRLEIERITAQIKAGTAKAEPVENATDAPIIPPMPEKIAQQIADQEAAEALIPAPLPKPSAPKPPAGGDKAAIKGLSVLPSPRRPSWAGRLFKLALCAVILGALVYIFADRLALLLPELRDVLMSYSGFVDRGFARFDLWVRALMSLVNDILS